MDQPPTDHESRLLSRLPSPYCLEAQEQLQQIADAAHANPYLGPGFVEKMYQEYEQDQRAEHAERLAKHRDRMKERGRIK